MRKPFAHLLLIAGLLGGATAQAAVVGKEIAYQAANDEAKLTGYIAYDDAVEGKRPAVLVVHEWWGHNDYARKRADMLAELGYVAMAVDMYGDGKQADHPKQAKEFMMAVKSNMKVGEARFHAALDLLKGNEQADPAKLAAIGYCFGGGMVLEMARRGIDLQGVASFHGSLGSDTPAAKDSIKPALIVFNGEADKMSPPEQVKAFEAEMQAAGANYELINYPGVMHSFTNPEADAFAKKFNMPLAYDKAADEDSWNKLQGFLKRIFSAE